MKRPTLPHHATHVANHAAGVANLVAAVPEGVVFRAPDIDRMLRSLRRIDIELANIRMVLLDAERKRQ
jgi:hypothetical protein